MRKLDLHAVSNKAKILPKLLRIIKYCSITTLKKYKAGCLLILMGRMNISTTIEHWQIYKSVKTKVFRHLV